MRLWLFAGVLVAGCFNPGSTGEGSSGGTTTGGTTVGGESTTLPGSTSAPTTTASSSGETRTSTTETTAIATSTTTGGETTTTGLTATTGSSSDATTSTTTSGECVTPCGPCEVCMEGVCVLVPADSDCAPTADACGDVLWGVDGNACYAAAASGGKCMGSQCVAKCDAKGSIAAACEDVACMFEDNPCTAGAPAIAVSVINFCATEGKPTPKCGPKCDSVTDVLQSYGCSDSGACEMGSPQKCSPWACTPGETMCGVQCITNVDCAFGFKCAAPQCVPI